jgi:hypothetical protein
MAASSSAVGGRRRCRLPRAAGRRRERAAELARAPRRPRGRLAAGRRSATPAAAGRPRVRRVRVRSRVAIGLAGTRRAARVTTDHRSHRRGVGSHAWRRSPGAVERGRKPQVGACRRLRPCEAARRSAGLVPAPTDRLDHPGHPVCVPPRAGSAPRFSGPAKDEWFDEGWYGGSHGASFLSSQGPCHHALSRADSARPSGRCCHTPSSSCVIWRRLVGPGRDPAAYRRVGRLDRFPGRLARHDRRDVGSHADAATYRSWLTRCGLPHLGRAVRARG